MTRFNLSEWALRNQPLLRYFIVVLALIIAVSVLTGAVVLSLSNYGSGRDRGFERSGMAGHWGSAHIQPHRSSWCMTCFSARPAGSAGAVNVGAAPA